MKTSPLLLTAALTAFVGPALQAGTVTVGDPIAGGIGYARTVQLSGNDSASFKSHVGAWSWEDNSLFGPGEDPVGWTHTSNWAAITLTEPTLLTLRMERDATVPQPLPGDPGHFAATTSMFPSFTLWSGWDNDVMPAGVATALGYTPASANDHDTYNNVGNVDWAEDLTYIGHVNNSTATFAEVSWVLPAGQYSVVLGSNAPATDTARQGYSATFTTVPEPGTAITLLFGLGVLTLRRHRQSIHR